MVNFATIKEKNISKNLLTGRSQICEELRDEKLIWAKKYGDFGRNIWQNYVPASLIFLINTELKSNFLLDNQDKNGNQDKKKIPANFSKKFILKNFKWL